MDSGTDLNAISHHDTWLTLQNQPELHGTKLKMATFARDHKGAIGHCDLDVFINNTNVGHRFYVMKLGRMNSSMLLGMPWQRTYNSSTNWKRDGIDYEVNNKKLFEPFVLEEHYKEDTESKEDASNDEPSSSTVPSKGRVQDNAQKRQHKTVFGLGTKEASHRTQLRWIPKMLKEAQKGKEQIWIPKHKDPSTKKDKEIMQETLSKSYMETTRLVRQSRSTQVWIAKRLKEEQKDKAWIWVPKNTLNHPPKPSTQTQNNKQANQIDKAKTQASEAYT